MRGNLVAPWALPVDCGSVSSVDAISLPSQPQYQESVGLRADTYENAERSGVSRPSDAEAPAAESYLPAHS